MTLSDFWHCQIMTLSDYDTFIFWHFQILTLSDSKTFRFWRFQLPWTDCSCWLVAPSLASFPAALALNMLFSYKTRKKTDENTSEFKRSIQLTFSLTFWVHRILCSLREAEESIYYDGSAVQCGAAWCGSFVELIRSIIFLLNQSIFHWCDRALYWYFFPVSRLLLNMYLWILQ